MSQTQPTPEGNQPRGIDKWILWNPEKENPKFFDARSAAEDKRDEVQDLFENVDLELYKPGEAPESMYHEDGPDPSADDDTVPCEVCGRAVDPGTVEFDAGNNPHHPDCLDNDDGDSDGAGGEPVKAEVVEHTDDSEDTAPVPDAEPTDETASALEHLGESIEHDPLNVLPSYMITHVDGDPSLNKRGVSVLAYHYDVSVLDKKTVVYPHETDYTSAVVEIEVENEDGQVYTGSGEAHVDETPKHQLLRMAETRAYKRAVIFATGTGIVGYQELMEDL